MTSRQVYKMAKTLFHRRKQAEAIPVLEASLLAYLKTRDSKRITLGRFAIRLEKDNLVVEEVPVEPINQRYFFFFPQPQPKPQREEVNAGLFADSTF